MNKIFNTKSFSMITWILGAIVVVKVLWVLAEWLIPFPTHGIVHEGSSLKHALHYKYRLASEDKLKVVDNKPSKPAPPKRSLKSYKLVGIYSKGPYAIATLMKGPRSFVISNDPKGGEVEGYRLVDVNTTAAFFKSGEEKATLRLIEKKAPSVGTVGNAVSTSPEKREKKPEPKKGDKIVHEGDTVTIDRSLIQEYTENPDKIWKNIGLYEVKHDGKLDGFKVRFVRKGSPFEKLGLKRGDLIKAINGEPIVDYATPMRMLRSADSIDDLSLTIERNHEEQELKYEVK